MSSGEQAKLVRSVDIDKPLIDVRVMRHDLQAQLINIKGLNREISNVVILMKKLLQKEQRALPDNFTCRMSELITEDLLPCIDFQNQSTAALDDLMSDYLEKISKIANQ